MLDRARSRKLTLVCGPAGSGKSTLLSQWVDTIGIPCGWLSLGEEDVVPVRFLTHLVATVRHAAPHVGGGAEALLNSVTDLNLEAVLETFVVIPLIEEPTELVLILDGLHIIADNSILCGLRFLVHHLPDNVHLIIATRTDLDMSLSELRVKGELNEVRGSDLRFNHEESRLFFNQTMGLDLTRDQIIAFDQRTEGWAAAMQLIALRLQSGVDVVDLMASLSSQESPVADFLLEEVLKHQRPEVREFLLTTSILKRMCTPLCQTLYGAAPLGISLRDLEREGLPLVSLDEEGEWYRYHTIFGDLLKTKLAQESKARVCELHKRASQWFAEQEMNSEAVEHAIVSQDRWLLADLVESACMRFLFDGDYATLTRWFDAVDSTIVEERPTLAWCRAWISVVTDDLSSITSHIERFQKCIETQSHTLSRDNHPLRQYAQLETNTIRAASAARCGKLGIALEFAEGILYALPSIIGNDDDFLRYRVSALNLIAGICLYSLGNTHRTVAHRKRSQTLSDREQQVLDFIALGMSNRQISKRLSVSEGTVKVHTHNLFGKLGVKNRIQAANEARKLGIIKD